MTTGAPVLMSPENPEGWKLEELLDRLVVEIEGKTKKIAGDQRSVARKVVAHNIEIIHWLEQAAELQRASMAALEEIGPNQGPLGTPRIGVGSEAVEASSSSPSSAERGAALASWPEAFRRDVEAALSQSAVVSDLTKRIAVLEQGTGGRSPVPCSDHAPTIDGDGIDRNEVAHEDPIGGMHSDGEVGDWEIGDDADDVLREAVRETMACALNDDLLDALFDGDVRRPDGSPIWPDLAMKKAAEKIICGQTTEAAMSWRWRIALSGDGPDGEESIEVSIESKFLRTRKYADLRQILTLIQPSEKERVALVLRRLAERLEAEVA